MNKDVALLITGISATGISVLLGLFWRFHKSSTDLLKLVSYANVDKELKSFESILGKMNIQLKEKIDHLEKEIGIDSETNVLRKKIAILNQIIYLSGRLAYIKGLNNADNRYEDLVREMQLIAGSDEDSIKVQLQLLIAKYQKVYYFGDQTF